MVDPMGKDVVYCSNPACLKPIALPHQSPLGTFEGLENQPTAEWPATFLCLACGQEFVCSESTIDDEIQVTAPPSQIPDLLQVVYEVAQNNSVVRKVIYTTCPKGSDPKGEIPRLQKYLGGTIVHFHLSSYR